MELRAHTYIIFQTSIIYFSTHPKQRQLVILYFMLLAIHIHSLHTHMYVHEASHVYMIHVFYTKVTILYSVPVPVPGTRTEKVHIK